MAILLKLVLKFLSRRLLIFISIFGLYIFQFTNPNLIRFDSANYLCILGMFDNINNNSKERPIRKAIVSIKIKQFHELVCNSIMHQFVLIWIKNINQR